MADAFFLTKTEVDPRQMIASGGATALERHDALTQFLAARIGRDAADLFAEPAISRGNGAAATTISWYAAHGGQPARLADLPAEARSEAEARLRQLLAAASEGLSDPDFGPLLGAALMQRDAGDVWVVDRRPVLVNWGVAPEEALVSQSARDRHFAATLGRFLPLAAAPALNGEEWRARGYSARAAAPDSEPAPAEAATAGVAGAAAGGTVAGAAAAAADPATQTVLVAEAADRWRWRWIAPALLLALFALILFWITRPGVLLYPPTPRAPAIADETLNDAARAANEALEERAAQLRAALEGGVCTAEGEFVLPGGVTPFGAAPLTPEQAQGPAPGPREAAPDALSPAPPAQLLTPPDGEGDPLPLLDRLEHGVALVLASAEEGSGHGTGFFIGPDLLVTNHHVVANALDGGRIFVTSEKLGQVRPAQVLRHDGPMEATGADFALLRVEGGGGRALAVSAAPGSLRLHHVVAAGYPGFVMETDRGFQALIEGDGAAAPGLVVTDGIVNAEQDLSANSEVLVHTAHISPGNSGGPLVDSCGRIVGVNTFIRNDQASLNSLNFSLDAATLLRFLREAGAEVTTVEQPCAPQVARGAQAAPDADGDAGAEAQE